MNVAETSTDEHALSGWEAVAPAAAPDGGYAWFILLSCFLVFGLTFGVIKAFGVFYVEIHQYFETTATGTAWITSIAVATIHFGLNSTKKVSDNRTKKDELRTKILKYVDYTLITNDRFMVQQLTATVILLGTVLLLCPLASSFSFGLVYGATVAIHITVLAEVVGVNRLGSALGFFMLIRSSGGLLGLPIAGFFIDKMSDYGTGFLMAGVALIVPALFLLLLHQMNRRGQGLTTKTIDTHTDMMGRSGRAEAKEQDMT
ncbi:LOW QUALITY PROTEIN: uncharacterized protein PEZ65_009524 [Lycodopsis pacificus]